MRDILIYFVWPNPGNASYTSPKVVALLLICAALILLSFIVKVWRARQINPVTRKLTSSWSGAIFWFGVVGLILVVARVEQIQFLAMRVLWIVWALVFALYLLLQARRWHLRHYEVLPRERVEDPREKYLPHTRHHS
jgi:hypothetical protein